MPRFRSTDQHVQRPLTSAEQVAELRNELIAAPDHMLTERAIMRRHIGDVRTLAKASGLITEYERIYGPGCTRRGKLDGGKVRVVCLHPAVRQ